MLALLSVTVIWGWSFVWMKDGLDAARGHLGPGTLPIAVGLFMTVRFGVSALLLPLVLPGARRLGQASIWRAAAVLSTVLLAAFLLQMFGLSGIRPAVSAFLTSLYVVFTALLARALGQPRAGPSLVAGVVLATLGAAYISGPPELSFDLPEWLTVLAGLLFAVQILATDYFTKRESTVPLTESLFVCMTLGSAATLAVGLGLAPQVGAQQIVRLLLDGAFWVPVLSAAVLGSVVALTAMNHYQKQLPPVRAAILYALEPVWTAVIALALGRGEADGWLAFGGAALLLGNLTAELGPFIAARFARATR